MIYVHGKGLRHGPKDVIDRLNRGEAVDPSSYYFRTTPYFETSSESYSWLNRICSIATGSRVGDRRGFDVYQVLLSNLSPGSVPGTPPLAANVGRLIAWGDPTRTFHA